MGKAMYYSINGFIKKLETCDFTFNDVIEATGAELNQIKTLKTNIVEANINNEPEATAYVIDQLELYIVKLEQFQGELPAYFMPDEPASAENIKLEKELVLKRLKELFQVE